MDSLSRLQGNFPTQELNWDLLHCSWSLYQLSYSGSPTSTYNTMLNRNDGSGHSYLALEFRGDTFSFSLLSVMLAVGLLYMAFIMLRYVPSGFPRWLSGKESTCQCRRHAFSPCIRNIWWKKKWPPTPVFLPGKFHVQRSLEGYSPWGCKDWIQLSG